MQLLARGRDSDVFALSSGRVLRRYRNAGQSAEREAVVMRHARDAGLQVPEVHDVQGPDLVLEWLAGPTMAAALRRRPWTVDRLARKLADVHRAVHAVAVPPELGLPAVDAGQVLLHLDLHPENVILTADGPHVIDWTNAASGTAAVDVADVWLLLSSVQLGGGPVGRVSRQLALRFARTFVAASGEAYALGVPAAAARRLRDPNMQAAERRRIAQLAGRHDS